MKKVYLHELFIKNAERYMKLFILRLWNNLLKRYYVLGLVILIFHAHTHPQTIEKRVRLTVSLFFYHNFL